MQLEPSILNEPNHRTWSIKHVEQPFKNANEIDDYHSFLLLMDETDPAHPIPMDELHFVPAAQKEDGRMILATVNTPGPYFLAAASYQNPARNMDDKKVVTYASGSPKHVLSIWNNALRIAAKITERKELFIPNDSDPRAINNCRSGARAVIEKLGHAFQKFAGPPIMALGADSDLAARIDFVPDTVADAAVLQKDFYALRQRLTVHREP